MSLRLKFTHCADLHLDSPFLGLRQLNGELADMCSRASFAAWDRFVDLSIREAVDFVLIAGDVYDSAERSVRAQLHFLNGLRRLASAGVRSFIIHGNHDALDGRLATLQFPPEVVVFAGDRVTSSVFSKDGQAVARIHGISFPKKFVPEGFGDDFRREGLEPLQIGLLHCTVGNYPDHHPYVPRTLEQLRAANLDYWALGHIHKGGVLCDEPRVVYPGVLQGRHINEDGPKGCVLVAWDSGRFDIEFRPLDSIRWLKEEVELSDSTSLDQVIDLLAERCEEMGRRAEGVPVIARLQLTGRCVISDEISANLDVLLQDLRQRGEDVYVERLEFGVEPSLDLLGRVGDGDLVGEVVRQHFRCRENTASIRDLLEPLWKKARLNELSDEDLQFLLFSSAMLAAEQLVRES